MEKVIINSYEEFEKLVGQQIGVSDYVELSQERINLFADATLDHQWIHVDTERQLYDIIRSTSAVALAATTPEVFMRYNSDPDVKALPVVDCDIYAQFAWIKSRRLPLSDLALELLEAVRPYFI